jgi:hypothetical protein
LSEVERGQKEASSELLASICDALGAPLSQVLREVSDSFALAELQNEPVFGVPLEPALARSGESADGAEQVPASPSPSAAHRPGVKLAQPANQRLVMPQRKITVRTSQRLGSSGEPIIEQVSLPSDEQKFDKLARDITNMVPV